MCDFISFLCDVCHLKFMFLVSFHHFCIYSIPLCVCVRRMQIKFMSLCSIRSLPCHVSPFEIFILMIFIRLFIQIFCVIFDKFCRCRNSFSFESNCLKFNSDKFRNGNIPETTKSGTTQTTEAKKYRMVNFRFESN